MNASKFLSTVLIVQLVTSPLVEISCDGRGNHFVSPVLTQAVAAAADRPAPRLAATRRNRWVAAFAFESFAPVPG